MLRFAGQFEKPVLLRVQLVQEIRRVIRELLRKERRGLTEGSNLKFVIAYFCALSKCQINVEVPFSLFSTK